MNGSSRMQPRAVRPEHACDSYCCQRLKHENVRCLKPDLLRFLCEFNPSETGSEPSCVPAPSFHLMRGSPRGHVTGNREMPAAANGHEPNPEAQERTRDCQRGRGEPKGDTKHHNSSACQGGKGIKICARGGPMLETIRPMGTDTQSCKLRNGHSAHGAGALPTAACATKCNQAQRNGIAIHGCDPCCVATRSTTTVSACSPSKPDRVTN